MTVTRRLADVVSQIPDVAGEPYGCRRLPGGLTNINYLVTTRSGRRLVVRLSSPQSADLGINRDHEYANSTAAAAAGVAPAVVAYLPHLQALVLEWIDGRTFTAADLMLDTNLEGVAALCRRLHSGPRFASDFDIFAVLDRYLRVVDDLGYRRPSDYRDHLPVVGRMRSAMSVRAAPSVPCHNDLLPANIMASRDRLWFIDFEYAGNGDACFDLGNLCSEAALDTEHLEHLVAAYFGRPSVPLTARTRLYALLSDYVWTLWACIQAAASTLDFDFYSWGVAKYERARAVFHRADLDQLLLDVQTP